MDELVKDRFLRLSDELVEEVFFRLPPDEPAYLVRASAVRKRWRQILADAGFRRRYREFHATPPVLGFFQEDASFVATSALLPAQPDHPGSIALDCRHGRALLAPPYRYWYQGGAEFTVLDPLTGHHRRVPFPRACGFNFSAAVVCATQGCDHHGCQGGHFLVACVSTQPVPGITSAYVYSSESGAWSEGTSHYGTGLIFPKMNAPSILLGDALYFNISAIVKCQLGTLSLSMIQNPFYCDGALMKAEDGGLGFATVVVGTSNLTLWSMETGPEGAMGWAKIRVIDLKILLPDGALPTLEYGTMSDWNTSVSGFAEGTQVIFVTTCAGFYMVDLKSRRARKVSRKVMYYSSHHQTCFPYMNFYIPAMEAGSTSQGQ